ncbi:MAG TPA: protein kinase [Capsulimonadaceae bacterium]|jgi:hypothetical protein
MKLRRRHTSEILTINESAVIAVGGEATIYAIHGRENLVAKIYHKDAEAKIVKLVSMIANPPPDPTSDQGHVSIAWPVDLLYSPDLRDFAGFVMPKSGGDRPLIDVYNPLARRQSAPFFSYRYLCRTARNVAAAVNAVHLRGYVIGDLTESNILVADTAMVTIVDTDSFQVRDRDGKTVHRSTMGRPDYTPPELQGASFADIDRLPEHDCFALGVLIFQLLMEGTHPFAGEYSGGDEILPYEGRIKAGFFPYGSADSPYRPKASAPPYGLLAPEIQNLFATCFREGHTQPRLRPSASTWIGALQSAEEHLLTCAANSQHAYGDHLASCPWCERKAALGGRDPFPGRDDFDLVASGRRAPVQKALPPSTPPAADTRPAPPQPPKAAPIIPPAATVSQPAASSPPPIAQAEAPGSRKPIALTVGILAVVLIAAVLSVMQISKAQRSGMISSMLTVADSRLRNTDAAFDSADQAAANLSFVTQQCDQAISMATPNMAGEIGQAGQIKARATAASDALSARRTLDDVTASIEDYSSRRLTPGQASRIRLSLLERCNAALAKCSRAIDMDPSCSAAWIERSRGYRLSANNAAADSALAKAKSLRPNDSRLDRLAH